MEGSDDEEAEGPHEVFGVHHLKLAPGTRSGYLGVRPTKSKKRPWQAWVHNARSTRNAQRTSPTHSRRP